MQTMDIKFVITLCPSMFPVKLLAHVMQVELPPGTADDMYLQKLQQALHAAAVMMPQPQLIIYNAGTDILAGDPLGRYGCLLARAEGVGVVKVFG
jgi:hypothetical protein